MSGSPLKSPFFADVSFQETAGQFRNARFRIISTAREHGIKWFWLAHRDEAVRERF
jgi:hypothetical protein